MGFRNYHIISLEVKIEPEDESIFARRFDLQRRSKFTRKITSHSQKDRYKLIQILSHIENRSDAFDLCLLWCIKFKYPMFPKFISQIPDQSEKHLIDGMIHLPSC